MIPAWWRQRTDESHRSHQLAARWHRGFTTLYIMAATTSALLCVWYVAAAGWHWSAAENHLKKGTTVPTEGTWAS